MKWYTQAGTPEVGATGMWNEAAQTYVLALTQHTNPSPGENEKSPMYIPLKFGLVGPNGEDIMYDGVSGGEVVDDVIILNGPSAELQFEGVAVRPVLSILREFSAPVKLANTQSETDQLFLAHHDSDPFNRWQASQGLAISMMAKAASGKGLIEVSQIDALSDALKDSLASNGLDNAFKALVLTLPDEGAVRQAIGKDIDPEAVYLVRRELTKEISLRLSEQLLATYHTLENKGPAGQKADEVKNRSLRNQCLKLLVASETKEANALASAHYYSANNMTDRMGALASIVHAWHDDALSHLSHFQKQYGSDPLINDKWLMLMSSAPDENCINRVKEIYNSKNFS